MELTDVQIMSLLPLVPVYDYDRYDEELGIAFCLICQSWVPTEGPFAGSRDRHIDDHLLVRQSFLGITLSEPGD